MFDQRRTNSAKIWGQSRPRLTEFGDLLADVGAQDGSTSDQLGRFGLFSGGKRPNSADVGRTWPKLAPRPELRAKPPVPKQLWGIFWTTSEFGGVARANFPRCVVIKCWATFGLPCSFALLYPESPRPPASQRWTRTRADHQGFPTKRTGGPTRAEQPRVRSTAAIFAEVPDGLRVVREGLVPKAATAQEQLRVSYLREPHGPGATLETRRVRAHVEGRPPELGAVVP